MRNYLLLFSVSVTLLLAPATTVFGKGDGTKNDQVMPSNPVPIHKFYIGSGLEGGNFSTATMQRPGFGNNLGTLRFTYFINFGITVNYNVSNHFGLYTGLDLKNIGFIEKRHDSTIKHRTYNLGLPLAVKVGNLKKKAFLMAGAGIDLPLNYREKEFTQRGHKNKFNEWFSDRTPHIMPYVFAGITLPPGISLKLQYYLNNYMNPDYTTTDAGIAIKPYNGYDVHLLLLSIGIAFPYSKPHTYDNKDGKPKPATGDDEQI